METIIVERNEGIVTVTMNRPHRKNAATPQTWEELRDTFRDIEARGTDRVLVITGAAGEFCSGADLGGVGEAARHSFYSMRVVADAAIGLHRLSIPSIAKVRGVAVGAGCNLALGCDLVVASENARFSEIFAKRGLSLDFAGAWLLPRRIGLHRAKELAFFADIISAQEADRIGLINRVVPDDELDAFVDGWAKRLAAAPPIAIANTKRLLNGSLNATFEQNIDDEGNSQAVNFSTKDTIEAVTAFIEKREPKFQGR